MRFERHQSIRMGGWRNFNSRMDGNEFCSNLNAHGVGTGAVSSCWLHRDEPSRCIACMNSSEAMILRRDTLGRVVFALQRQIELLCQPARNQILHFRPPFSPSVAPSLLHLWDPPLQYRLHHRSRRRIRINAHRMNRIHADVQNTPASEATR